MVSVTEMQTVNGNLIGGEVAAANGNLFIVYAYNLPTFDLLKKPVYQDALNSVGMKPLLDSLPWGVDLKTCVDFSSHTIRRLERASSKASTTLNIK